MGTLSSIHFAFSQDNMKKRTRILLGVLALTLVTWAQGWYMVYQERSPHRPVCFPVAPFVIYSRDTNDLGPAAKGIYIAYFIGVYCVGERVTWVCSLPQLLGSNTGHDNPGMVIRIHFSV